MPLLDKIMVIQGPFWQLLLIALGILALLATSAWLFLRRSRQQVSTLARNVEALKKELASRQPEPADEPSSQEAYLQFTYNLSHEVSNPLQSVQTNLDNMASCSPDEVGRWRQYYLIIKQEIRRLSTLTENLRLLSQLERVRQPVKREPVNLKSVIEDVIMAQAERAAGENIGLTYEGPNRPAKVLGNRDHLYQLIINLVDNSIKYSKDSGGTIVISLQEDANSVHVKVKDDGIGIPNTDIPFVFDTAYRSPGALTLRRAGSGLGLAIVKRIVGQHDGQVRVESNVGEGTAVVIDLPLYNPAPQLQ